MIDRFPVLKQLVHGWRTNHIVALYALIGSAWILLSDRLVVFNAPDPATATLFSTLKGLAYVVVTAALLHWLINRYTAELRESEARFRIIFEHANDAIHIDNADDEILDVNPRMCELMGYSRDELLAMRIPDLQAPERRAAGHVITTELAQHGDKLFEGLNLHRSGQPIPVEISVARVPGPTGDLYVSVIRDITERKRAEDKLRQSESLLRAVVDNVPFEFWARDLEGRCFMENTALVEHWGSLLGTHVEDGVAPPQAVAQWIANNARALAGEVVNEETDYVIHGDRRQFQNIVAPLRIGDEIRGILGLNIDITDRKRAEEELRQSQAFNQALIDHSPLGISVRSRTGQLLFANAAWRKIWAIAEADLHDDMTRARDKLQFNVRDDYLALYQADLRRVYEQGGHLHLPELKTTLPRPGAAEWVAQHFYAITDRRGQVDRVVILTEDVSERKRTEEALRASEEQFRSLVEQSPLSTQVLALDGRTVQVNRAFEVLWGLHLEDLTNYNILTDQQLVRLGLMPYVRRGFSGEAASIPAAEYDSRESVGTGEKQWVQARIYPVKDEAGNIRQVILMHEDITSRKRAEGALRESEERYRRLVETSPDPIFLHQAGRFVFVNPAACKLLGAESPDALIGRPIIDIIHPDYHTVVADRVRQAVDENRPVPLIEEMYVRLDGSHVNVEVAASSLLIDGQPTMQVIARDITERKRREREIEAIATIATALRTAATRDDMIPAIVQQMHNLLNVDGAALILREPVTGEAVIVHGLGVGKDSIGLHIPRGRGIVGHVIATGHPYLTQNVEHDPHVFRPDLVSELRALVCVPLIAHDQIIGVLWAGRTTTITEEEARLLTAIADIAANALHRAEVLETLEQRVYDRTRELAKANERLTELDRLKDKFVSDVSHELRTPITSLMLNVELLEHGKPEKREHYLRVIRQQTARQVQLIEDILNLSRLDLSATRAQLAPVKINELINQAVNMYHSSAEAANLRLNFVPEPGEPVVLGVESHLSQVVTNLIANAINYTPAGSVDVATRLVNQDVLIEVRDTGLGIAPEDLPHLFDRFYRGKLTWQVRGSGLGLAIVKEITEAHHGHVEVDSQAGVGSTFRVYLPVI